uniref:Uncharacterized protein n=1 Tax=Panagrolaimus sp. PS1159 TaxID=55785 RepID=A0AC35G786_9BILA
MSNFTGEVEKIIRYLIEIKTIYIFNKEDDVINYLKEINEYKWPKGAKLECHLIAANFCARILLPDEYLYISHFKWIVMWLKLKEAYRFSGNGKFRDELLQEFLTVQNVLKNGDVNRSRHHWPNTFTEMYHVYAHYTDTRRSLFYQKHFSDLSLGESFLQGR